MSFFLGNRHKLAAIGLFLTLIDILGKRKGLGSMDTNGGNLGISSQKSKEKHSSTGES
jgi:hypothetical protein